ncbi:MAG: caspase family protein, partial [Myxococcales bacterium]|nr:caspase family protein [Myxococcales bacterium]
MKRHAWAAVVGLVLLLTRAHAARVTEPTPPQPRAVFALLIGYSEGPPGLGLPALTRAESDVVMMNAFFGTLGPEAVYVHIESAATRSALAVPGRVHVGPATFPAIMASVRAIEQALEDAGPADVYVYYAGHGQRVRVDERAQTELFLRPVGAGAGNDGVLRSTLLQSEILVPLSADEDTRVHLVVDACQSYFVLEARKGLRQVARARKAPPPIEVDMIGRFLDRFERVGALLATNGSQVTYEDPEIGGLFSYAVRSAGIGSADLDRDGRVTYGELERALPWILGQRTGGGPPGLVAPDNDPETAFVDYRGRGVAAVEFAPREPTRYELTHMPSHQKYAVLYPGRAPVRAWLPRGQEYVTALRRSPTG